MSQNCYIKSSASLFREYTRHRRNSERWGPLHAGYFMQALVVTDHGFLYVQKISDEETMSTPERNAPCPCGSGKKYKQCCGRADRATPEGEYDRIRRMDGAASDALGRMFKQIHGRDEFLAAHAEFHPGLEGPLNPDDPETDFFLRWYFYDWLPVEGEQPAVAFLKKRDPRVDPDVYTLVDKTLKSPYSFLQVTAVSPGVSFIARDILRKREFTITERVVTKNIEPGHIVYARVVEWDGLCFMMGTGPQVIPGQYLGEIAELRDEYLRDRGTTGEPIPDDDLRVLEDDMRHTYFAMLDDILERARDIHNTDGDPLEFHTLRYDVSSFKGAFDALRGLEPDATDLELMQAGDSEPGIVGENAVIHWSKRKKGGAKEDTVVQAVFRLKGTALTVEANSAKRVARVRKEVEKRLGKEAVYLGTTIDSLEGAMKRGGDESGDRDPAERAADQAQLMALPEVQAKLKEMMDKHWATWPDTPIPALRGMTPRQAARDPRGRELLESLLLDFESRNRHAPGGIDRVDVAKLRKELGMVRR
jgi:hypothetical protein